MHTRLAKLIEYKTEGRRGEFASLMGWSPQYLTKLLRGESFGLQPVLAVLAAFPEINARWFLFGVGDVHDLSAAYDLRRQATERAQGLLDLERYVPVMSPDELSAYSSALMGGRYPGFAPDTMAALRRRLAERDARMADIFGKAYAAAFGTDAGK